jgi:hypothetical protein
MSFLPTIKSSPTCPLLQELKLHTIKTDRQTGSHSAEENIHLHTTLVVARKMKSFQHIPKRALQINKKDYGLSIP